jgi:hypothetical protein
MYMMDNFFKAMKDSDWGESVTDLDFNTHSQEMLDDCERSVKNEPELEYDMVVRKSWSEYAKEINRMRAQLRYMKKSVGYRGGCYSPYENQKDIIDCEKEIKRLCKLRDAAKAMEKVSGHKMGEMKC